MKWRVVLDSENPAVCLGGGTDFSGYRVAFAALRRNAVDETLQQRAVDFLRAYRLEVFSGVSFGNEEERQAWMVVPGRAQRAAALSLPTSETTGKVRFRPVFAGRPQTPNPVNNISRTTHRGRAAGLRPLNISFLQRWYGDISDAPGLSLRHAGRVSATLQTSSNGELTA